MKISRLLPVLNHCFWITYNPRQQNRRETKPLKDRKQLIWGSQKSDSLRLVTTKSKERQNIQQSIEAIYHGSSSALTNIMLILRDYPKKWKSAEMIMLQNLESKWATNFTLLDEHKIEYLQGATHLPHLCTIFRADFSNHWPHSYWLPGLTISIVSYEVTNTCKQTSQLVCEMKNSDKRSLSSY